MPGFPFKSIENIFLVTSRDSAVLVTKFTGSEIEIYKSKKRKAVLEVA